MFAGKFSNNCYRIFCCGEFDLEATEPSLKKYLLWKKNKDKDIQTIEKSVEVKKTSKAKNGKSPYFNPKAKDGEAKSKDILEAFKNRSKKKEMEEERETDKKEVWSSSESEEIEDERQNGIESETEQIQVRNTME